jgi:hypothetical protein
MKAILLPLFFLAAATGALAQRSTIQIGWNSSTAGIVNPDWSIKNMSMRIPYYEPTSMLPADILPKQARIEFIIFETRSLDPDIISGKRSPSLVRCTGTWDPWFPLQELTACEDKHTFWRFALGQFWDESSFWIDIIRPGYVP